MQTKKYKYLDPLFVFFSGWRLFEKWTGMKDAKENQICELNEGHITPEINTKIHCYDSHINKIFLKTAKELEPMVEEANALVIELNSLLDYKETIMGGNSEEARRQAAKAAAKGASVSERKTAILKRLAEIKTESDMVDEMLLHYEERAQGILNKRISKYWKGVLSVMKTEDLAHFPIASHEESIARKKYNENRQKLISMIDNAINHEGGKCYVEIQEEEK